MGESTTWSPESSDSEHNNDHDNSLENFPNLDPTSNLDRIALPRETLTRSRRLVVDEQDSDPWEWAHAIQRERMSETWDGRILLSWTRKKSLITGLLLSIAVMSVMLLLKSVFAYELVQTIAVAGYATATMVAIGIGFVLEIQLR
ncbi:hypothetical protein BKA65DRAFT_506945 [Rhexocercosporidium sp. MPI-PUGE-AT-0058]|nr:hypothetical protein BKA65DRAFT_506945 [Rhexocercosporidium sp. MPI-PUGE-AT-0058]